MSEIPEDIKKIADGLAAEVDADWSWDGQCWPADAVKAEARTADAIARAILAERERCEEIIQPFTVQGGVGGAYIRKAAWSALDAIRAAALSPPSNGDK